MSITSSTTVYENVFDHWTFCLDSAALLALDCLFHERRLKYSRYLQTPTACPGRQCGFAERVNAAVQAQSTRDESSDSILF